MIVYFSCPHDGYYRPEITAFRDAAKAYLKARGHALIWEPVRDRPTMACRNNQVNKFLRSPADLFLSMDYDCLPDRDGQPDIEGLQLMLDAMERDDIDVLYGWSLIWTGNGMVPCVTLKHDGTGNWPVNFVAPYSPEPLHELKGGACGSHCFMVKRKVFEGMKGPGVLWFDDVHDRNPESEKYGGRVQGHDVSFCMQAQDRGFRLWVDNRILWGHVKDVDLRWIHNVVRDLTRRLDAHTAVAEQACPNVPAWMTLRLAEERARHRYVRVVLDGVGEMYPPERADVEAHVILFDDVESPSFKSYMDSVRDLPVNAESVGNGVVVTL